MSLEISNIYSVLAIIQIFILIFLVREEGGIHFSADCLGGIMKICMYLGGDIKNEPLKKNPLSPPPVAYIMNAALKTHGVGPHAVWKEALHNLQKLSLGLACFLEQIT